MAKATIILGGMSYDIGPMTLGQMKRIGVGSQRWRAGGGDAAAAEQAWYDGTFDILAAALGRTRDQIEALAGVTFDELVAANRTILEVSGLKTKEASPALGEARGATG